MSLFVASIWHTLEGVGIIVGVLLFVLLFAYAFAGDQ
jgi:hypothetical protein